MHWLRTAALRARLPAADELNIAPGATLTDAWDAAARGLGFAHRELAERLAPTLGVRVANLEISDPRALQLLPERIARKYHVFPLREDDRTFTVATSDPTDLETEQAISFASGRRAVFELAPPIALIDAINGGYSPDRAVERLLGSADAHIDDAVRLIEETAPEAVAQDDIASGPIVKLTNVILRDAVVAAASDIHVEPGPKGGAVRFRIDGVLRTHMQMPMAALNRIVSRIKVLAKLDIADRLRPQDGRARISVDGKPYDLRVSTVPTREAEKAVVRILRPESAKSLASAGMPGRELGLIRQLLGYREGIVLVTGPTGSGKTTTLYAAIREIAERGNVNITTVEDPIEYELPGITQMQVETKRDMTFASALRAILRQDPDVIFVGEIRDSETADIAVQAALTGHLVLSTLHTNDALSTITRLSDFGIPRASVAASLRGAVAQRLVRRVCPDCALKITGEMTAEEQRLASIFGTKPAMRVIGCPACAGTGYRGRIPVVEVAMVTPPVAELIAGETSLGVLQRAATAGGMRTLREVALERVREGLTTLQEVERVVGEGTEDVVVATSAASAAEPARPPSTNTPRIMVVDDDPLLRAVASKLLREAGYHVEIAADGRMALEQLEGRNDVHLVITDLHMPQLGGAGLLNALRTSDTSANLPVIVLTSSDDHEEEIRMIDAGADDYIRKPIAPDRFIARIRAALRRANS